MEIFRLFGRIMIDDKEAQSSLSKTEKNAEGLAKRFGGMIKTAAKWGAAIVGAATAAATAAFAATNRITQGFDTIAKHSAKLGISTDAYQEMSYWASQNGISIQSMERAVGRLNQRIGLAATGNKKYADALESLGINLNDVRNGALSTEEVMVQVLQSLSQLENEQLKSAMAANLFGTRLARDLMPALQDSSMTIEEAREAAERLGLVIDEETIKAGVRFQDNLTDVKASLSAVGQNVMGQLIPVFNTLMEWFLENVPAIQALIRDGAAVVRTAVGWVVDIIQTVIGTLREWLAESGITLGGIREAADRILPEVLKIVQSVFGSIWDVVQDILRRVRDFWNRNGQQLLEDGKAVFNSIWGVVQTVFESIRDIIETVLNLVVPFVRRQLDNLQQFWEENGQQIMQAVSNAFKFIQSVIQTTMPIIQFIIEQVWGVIQGIFDGALKVVMGLLKTFAGLFTGDWRTMWEGIKQMISGALQFIWNLINLTLLGRALGVIRSFGSQLMAAFKTPFNWVKNFINTILNAITSRAKSFASQFTGAFKVIPDGIRAVLNRIISGFNSLIGGLNRFKISIPDWVPAIGGRSFGINIPTIPGLARGGVVTRSGSVLVGEAGPEILNLPRGASVIPLDHPSAGMDYDRLAEALARHMKPSVVFNNHFSVGESTPSQYLRKQRQLAREWGLNY